MNEPTLAQRIAAMPNLRPSPFALVELPMELEEPQPADAVPATVTLDSSITTADPAALSDADREHLNLFHRYGQPVHAIEVRALMDKHALDKDPVHLRRAIAILQHQLTLTP